MNLSFYCRPLCMIAGLLLSVGATGQVSFERILNAADEPHNWLTYNGGYSVSGTAN